MAFLTEQEKIYRKFILFSEKHHKLSLLFYELAESVRIAGRNKSPKEFKLYLKSLNLDIEKMKKLSVSISDIELNDLQKEKKIEWRN